MGLLFFISAQDVVVIPPDPGGEVVVVNISSVYDIDPYLDQTVLLLHGDSLIDECGKVITANGNVSVSGAKKKFGTGSLYFDGSGDYLSIPSSTDVELGTSDFTLETWVNFSGYPINTAGAYSFMLACKDVNGSRGFNWAVGGTASSLNVCNFGQPGVWTCSASYNFSLNTWYHIAVVRLNGTVSIFINGVFISSASGPSIPATTSPFKIGSNEYDATYKYYLNGYLDDFRFTKGVARYINNFAVPSKAFPDYQYSDPEWDSTILLLRGEGYNGSTNIKDDIGRTITATGTTINTTQKKYGNSSLYHSTYSSAAVVPHDSRFAFGLNDFTVEMWIYPTTLHGSGINSYICNLGSILMYINPDSGQKLRAQVNSTDFGGTQTISVNQWQHIALVRTGSTLTLYYNGTSINTTTFSASVNLNTNSKYIGSYDTSSGYGFIGYTDETRIYNGYAKYLANFTPAQQTLPSVFPTYEQYADSTVLLINGNGVNNSTNIKDETGKPVTVSGNTRISTAQSKFNGSSIYFDGTTDYINLNGHQDFAFGTGDFTVEGWFNSTGGAGTYRTLFSTYSSTNTTANFMLYIRPDNGLRFQIGSSNIAIETTASLVVLNTWNHYAIVRQNNVTKLYLNGVSLGSYNDTINYQITADKPLIGIEWNGTSNAFVGYMNDICISRFARYTANFTPPTESFKYITNQPTIPYYDYYYDNVSLLLKGEGGAGLQNNKFIDSSSNNAIPTLTGVISQGSVSPYSGFGSAYYDGGTNRLSLPSSNAFDLSGGTFTIEFWMKPTAYPSVTNRILMAGINNFSNAWQFDFYTSGLLGVGRPTTPATGILSSSSVPLNTWTHIAMVCNAGSAKIYFNGILVAGPVNITLPTSGNIPLYIGYDTVGTVDGKYTGYISNLHITKSAKYTANFTPLTTPVVSDANTTLLMNFNQANIIDSVGKQNLVSYGNVTTSPIRKIGQSSLYFDGNGDYLTASSNDFNFGTNDFTIEAWVYPISGGTWYSIFDTRNANGSNGCVFLLSSANALYIGNGVTSVGSANGVVPYNVWSHVAVSRVSGTATLYVNGVNVGSGALGTSYSLTNARIGASFDSYYYSGYIDGLRITKGVARYTAAFTPPYLDYATTRFDSYDPHWTKNVLLIHGEGTNNSTAITDVTGKTITVAGNTKISTTQSKFGNGSVYFDGNGDYLTIPQTGFPIVYGTPYTWESWIYPTASGVQQALFSLYETNVTWRMNITCSINTSNQFYVSVFQVASSTPTTQVTTHTTAITLNTWNHLAFCYNGSTFALFVNGIKFEATCTLTAFTTYGGNYAWIGISRNQAALGSAYTGYIQDMRVTPGLARYTKNFAPLQSRIPNPISNFDPYYDNVTLLLKGEGDNNSTTITDQKGHTITANGNAKISTSQSKFGMSSIAFDGTGDYVSIPNSTDFDFTNQNFTIEFWFNANTTTPTFQTLISKSTNDGGATGPWVIQLHNNNLQFLMDGTASNVTWDLFDYTSPSTITTGQWYHVALARSGTTVGCFINGILQNTISVGTNSVKQTSYPVLLGGIQYSGGIIQNFNGYIDDVRITKGVARYTGSFPVPVNTQPCGSVDKRYLELTTTQATSMIKSGSLWGTLAQGSIEFWINTTSCTVYTEQVATGVVYGIGVNANAVTLSVWRSPSSWYTVMSNATLVTGAWNHVVLTRDASNQVVFYINGVLDKTVSIAYGAHNGSTTSSNIGWVTGATGGIGSLNKIRLYNSVLSQQDVTTHYNNGVILDVSKDLNLIAGYNFDTYSSYIVDVSGNGNDFVLGSGCVIQPYNI